MGRVGRLYTGGGELRPDDVVPCVEKLDKALEVQLHTTLGMDVISSAERSFIRSSDDTEVSLVPL